LFLHGLSFLSPVRVREGSLGEPLEPSGQFYDGNELAPTAADDLELGHHVLVEEVARAAERGRGLVG
jgi:hypothetical protein